MVCRGIEGFKVHPELAKRNYIFLRSVGKHLAGVDTLFQALDTDLEHTRAHTKFLVRAREWEASGRDSGKLLRGADLIEADKWLSSVTDKLPSPTHLHADHIMASKDEERAERDKRRQIIGRAFVKPARQAMESGINDRVLRLVAAGATLADDITLELVPELWEPAAQAAFWNRSIAVLAGHERRLATRHSALTGTSF